MSGKMYYSLPPLDVDTQQMIIKRELGGACSGFIHHVLCDVLVGF